MNPSEAETNARQNVYQSILKTANKRLEQAIPGSEGAFACLSLAALLNLLFLTRGEWGSIGDYVTTQRAVRALVELWVASDNRPDEFSVPLRFA